MAKWYNGRYHGSPSRKGGGGGSLPFWVLSLGVITLLFSEYWLSIIVGLIIAIIIGVIIKISKEVD